MPISLIADAATLIVVLGGGLGVYVKLSKLVKSTELTLRTELQSHRMEMKEDMLSLRTEMKEDMQSLRTDMNNGFEKLGSRVQVVELSVAGLEGKTEAWTSLIATSMEVISAQSAARLALVHD